MLAIFWHNDIFQIKDEQNRNKQNNDHKAESKPKDNVSEEHKKSTSATIGLTETFLTCNCIF